MSDYDLTQLAKVDIFAIWAFIAEDNEDAADRVQQAIYGACKFLAESPLRGHYRKDLTKRALRFWTLTRYPNYTIVSGLKPLRSKWWLFCMARGMVGAF